MSNLGATQEMSPDVMTARDRQSEPGCSTLGGRRFGLSGRFGDIGQAQSFLIPSGSLSHRMAMLVGAMVVPLLCLGVWTVWSQYLVERNRAEAALVEHAWAIAQLVDREFDRAELTAQVLGASQSLIRGDLSAFDGEMRDARDVLAHDLPPGARPPVLTWVDGTGMWRLSSLLPAGEMPKDVGGLPEARQAMEEGKSRIFNLIRAPVTGRLIVGAVAVVWSPSDAEGYRQILGAMTVTVPRERFVEIVTHTDLPSQAIIAIRDRTGAAIARSADDARLVGTRVSPDQQKMIAAIDGGLLPRGSLTLDGTPSTIAVAHAARSGYAVTISMPEQAMLAPVRTSLYQGAAIGALVLAAGTVLATIVARLTVGNFRTALAVATEGAQQGGQLVRFTGLREADELAALLAETLAERDRAANELRAVFETSPIGVSVADVGGQIHQANDTYLGIIGRSRTELEAGTLRWDEITAPELLARTRAAVDETCKTGRCAPFEKEYLHPDGHRVPVLVSFGILDRKAGLGACFTVDLTELRAAETARQESEAFAHRILEASSDCILVLDADERFTFINGPGRDQLEIDSPAEVIGRSMTDFWPEDHAPLMRPALDKAWSGHVASLTAYGPTAKDTPKWWDMIISPLPGPEGQPSRLLAVIRDVTSLRQTQFDLAKHAERQELLLQVSDAILESSGNERTLAEVVSERVSEQLEVDICFSYQFDADAGLLHLMSEPGHSPAVLGMVDTLHVGQGYCGIVAQTREALIADAARIATDEQGVFARQLDYRAFACFPLFGMDGLLLGTIAFARRYGDGFTADEAEFLHALSHFVALAWQRYRAEAALRDSEARFRVITDSMPQAVWSAGADGQTDYLNQRWYDWTGISLAGRRNDGWQIAIHPDDRERVLAQRQNSLTTGGAFEMELRLRMVDGQYRWVLARALAIRDPETNAVTRWLGTCTDIDDTVRARDALRRTRDDLEALVAERTRDLQATQERLAHTQRMEALGQLAGGVAHDFNNVLQAVQGGAALIDRHLGDPARVRRLTAMITDSTERGAAITSRLLAFARRGDLKAEPVDPGALQASVRELLAHTLGDGIKVHLDLAPDLPAMLVDRGQLETVLINLATNARDAMAGIGKITLAGLRDFITPKQAAHHPALLKPGAYVRLSVTDTGTGMDAATLARASEPFFTTKPAGKGTGLGLAMARGFAEQSGGGLHIASELGRGTTVSMWFPLAADSRAQDAGVTSGAKAVDHHAGARVLLVDDDEAVREVTAKQLQAAGFEVIPVASPVTALAVLERGEPVHIIVSDLSMPEMDGVTLIREAYRRNPELPAILLTGFATNAAELAVAGAPAGKFSLLRKPISGNVLAERISALLDRAQTAR